MPAVSFVVYRGKVLLGPWVLDWVMRAFPFCFVPQATVERRLLLVYQDLVYTFTSEIDGSLPLTMLSATCNFKKALTTSS